MPEEYPLCHFIREDQVQNHLHNKHGLDSMTVGWPHLHSRATLQMICLKEICQLCARSPSRIREVVGISKVLLQTAVCYVNSIYYRLYCELLQCHAHLTALLKTRTIYKTIILSLSWCSFKKSVRRNWMEATVEPSGLPTPKTL